MDKTLENLIVAMTPGGIEAQESAGQAQFVGAKDRLPIDCPRKELEALGFVFGESADDLFVTVTFPNGWKKKATEHSMWSDLIDDKGRKRGMIFYKAAFYDRSAHMSLQPRFSIEQRYVDENGKDAEYSVSTHRAYGVLDNATKKPKRMFTSQAVKFQDWPAMDAAKAAARTWISATYPKWESAAEYWPA